jgi:ATP-binding cassette subfamily F protein 3
MPKGYTVGHLSQHLEFREASVLDEVCAGLGERVAEERYRAEAALMGLGFTRADLARPAREFSGGFQIRVNLARVLVEQPNLLLLDEPTNYLDIVSVRWLERFLNAWRDELIVITRDRSFLERVTTHTMAVHRRALRRMPGTVEKLYGQIGTEEQIHENARANEAKRRARDVRFIERFRAKNTKASAVQSRN